MKCLLDGQILSSYTRKSTIITIFCNPKILGLDCCQSTYSGLVKSALFTNRKSYDLGCCDCNN